MRRRSTVRSAAAGGEDPPLRRPSIADQVSVRVIGGRLPRRHVGGLCALARADRCRQGARPHPVSRRPELGGDARWGDTFLPGALDSWRIGGRVYGLPFAYSCWTIFYNRGLFRAHGWAEPRTWEEFFALCDRIRAAGARAAQHAGDAGALSGRLFSRRVLQPGRRRRLGAPERPGARSAGGSALYSGRAGSSSASARDAAGWEGETHTGAELAFLQGRAAMTVSGSWMLNEMEGKIPEGFDLGTMNFPVFPDGVADPTTIQTASDCFFVFDTGDAGARTADGGFPPVPDVARAGGGLCAASGLPGGRPRGARWGRIRRACGTRRR